jgi:ethanolamine utilization protein EutA (predicted chaperonin)
MIGGADNTGKIKEEIALALRNYNLIDGVDDFALFFNDINIRADLVLFSRSIVTALPKTIAKNKSIIIILGFDGAKMLGLTMKKQIAFNGSLFCLDELFLESGDWIDIGRPIGEGKSFPITIKSLVFKQNSQTKKI